jgi:hypothetical protein
MTKVGQSALKGAREALVYTRDQNKGSKTCQVKMRNQSTRKSILEAVYETANGSYNIALIDVVAVHKYDSLCLDPD